MIQLSIKDKKRLDDLIKELERFRRLLKRYDYIHNKGKFFELMRDLRRFIATYNEQEICDIFFHSKYYRDHRKFFQEMNNYYIRAVEAVEAISIMTKGWYWKEKFIDLLEVELIRDRYSYKGDWIQMLDFATVEKLVLVWCWSMPETMIYINENADLKKITAIDDNYEAIYIAWEMVASLWLQNIDLVYWDWIDFDYKDADIVFIPSFTPKKDEILKSIVKSSKDNVQILVRSPKYLSHMLFDTMHLEFHPQLRVVDIRKSNSEFSTQEFVKIMKYNY